MFGYLNFLILAHNTVSKGHLGTLMMLQQFKAELFKALSHPVRIRMLELLRDQERTVTELQAALQIEHSTVSQQLTVLRARNIVDTRKEGTSVYYRVRDPRVFDLLDTARVLFNNQLARLQNMIPSDERTTGLHSEALSGAFDEVVANSIGNSGGK